MNLLLLSVEFPPGPGGIGSLAYQLALRLTQMGWNVFVVTPQNFVDDAEVVNFNAQQPFHISTITYRGAQWREGANRFGVAYNVARHHNVDAVTAIGEQALWLGMALSQVLRKPYLAIGCGTEFVRGNALHRKLTQLACNQASRAVAISTHTQVLMEKAGVRSENIVKILGGADSDVYRPNLATQPLRQEYALDNTNVILTVGRMSERKAQDIVIKALPLIRDAGHNVKYLIVGLPTIQEKLAALAKAEGVEDHVLFLGRMPLETLPYLYNLADIFVMVSRTTDKGDVEGYGIVVTEAALCGTPAVVANHSGLLETVVDGETGTVVEPDSPTETAAAIIAMLNDPQKLEAMGQAALDRARAQATWAKRIAEYDAVLRSISKN